jgi:peroxiredoxin
MALRMKLSTVVSGIRPVWLPLLLLLFVAATTRASHAQSAEQLLQDTAKNYQALHDDELSGHATVAIPGSVWQFNVNFTAIGPYKEPSPDGGLPKQNPGGVQVGGGTPVKTVADSTEPPPAGFSIPFGLFGEFGTKIADKVVAVARAGSETLQLSGQPVACDILKVTYTPSTYEHPHPESASFWISPEKHLVLKEVVVSSAGRHIDNAVWTIVFDSVKFNHPTPQWLLDVANIPDLKERSEWIGKQAPAFSLPASDGAPVSLSSLKGKVVLLDFWSITCGPCKLEMPMLEEAGREFESKGVVLMGISFDPTDKSKTWLDRNQRTLHTLTDSDFVTSDAYKVQGIPALVLIGKDGKVKRYWEGTVTKAIVEDALNSELKR